MAAHPTHFKLGQDVYISAENLATWFTERQTEALGRCVEPTEFEEVTAYWRGSAAAFGHIKNYITEVSGADYD